MWAEAMGKLEGMESADRERLWPQLVQGFKDLSNRLKVLDSVNTIMHFSIEIYLLTRRYAPRLHKKPVDKVVANENALSEA